MSDKYHQQNLFENFDIEFVKRSRQRNLRIRVRNNRVTVSGPLACRETVMREFLNQHWNWVEKSLQKQHTRNQRLEQQREIFRNHVLLKGEWLPLQRSNGQIKGSNWNFKLSNKAVWFTPPSGIENFPDSKTVHTYLKALAKPEILARFRKVALNLPFNYNRVFIRSQKTKWGTCSGKGNLSFNWRLIKCPYWIWDYLFVHELCHTIHFNHSKAYWQLVDRHYPERKKAEAWIKQHGDVVFHT